ncbi:MAG TPA: hypothetical protein VGJ78_00875 [Vicinamibacterales bacterium]
MWIAGSESLLSFPLILFLHSIGMGLSAGAAFVVCMRLVGVARPLPVSSLRIFFKIFWVGFFLNLVTGSLLFAAHATTTGVIPMYYIKLALIAAGMVLSVPIRRFVDGEASDGVIPANIKGLAALSLLVWVGVITTGRLIAYVG